MITKKIGIIGCGNMGGAILYGALESGVLAKENVYVYDINPAMMDKAVEYIKTIVTDFQEGQIFKGIVVSIKEFGAFVEFAPGKEGMVHISKIAKERINRVEDVLTLGDKVTVVCLGKDKMGRMSFSMKDVAQQ